MNKNEQVYEQVKKEILLGIYGKSGDRFLSIRDFCKKTNIPFSRGYAIFQKLESEYLINVIKQKWFLTYGIADDNSEIKKISSNNLVGLHAKEIDNPYITSIISSLKLYLANQGYTLIIQTSENNSQDEIKILNHFISLGCSGVINFPSTETTINNYYKNYPLPMVFIGRKINIENTYTLPSVLTDNYEAGRAVAHMLIEKGYKEFYFVTHKYFSTNINKRLMGFRNELNTRIEELFAENNVFELDYSDSQRMRIFCKNIIKNSTVNNPIAIFCINDLFAAKILTILISLGADIPNTIGIVGYDDLPICQYTSPTITSVSYSLKEMAIQTVKLLFSINNGNPQLNNAIYIPNYISNRKSTATPPRKK